jgi:hypothetical protein
MTARSDIIERMAMALYASQAFPTTWRQVEDETRADYRLDATALKMCLARAGLRISLAPKKDRKGK